MLKISALKGIIKRHEVKCHRRYGASWRAESILRLILNRFCEKELNENEVVLVDSWYEFLKKECVPGSSVGLSGTGVRKFKCLVKNE